MKALLILALAITFTAQGADPAWFHRMDDRERARFDAEWRQLVRQAQIDQAQAQRDAVQAQIALLLQIQVLQAQQQGAQIPRR